MAVLVTFVYKLGVPAREFDGGNVQSARVVGSWDAAGRYSDTWTPRDMKVISGGESDDGCPQYIGTVHLDAAAVGTRFYWGVTVCLRSRPEQQLWMVATEEASAARNDCRREFVLQSAPATVTYYLSHARHLGANKVAAVPGRSPAGIRFGVWAPSAQRVDVVFGSVWDRNHPGVPITEPTPIASLNGGYITDDGRGVRRDMPVVPLTRGPDGVWLSDVVPAPAQAARPTLALGTLDHAPYMYRIVKDDARSRDAYSYRTDLYSRCQIGYGWTRPADSTYDPDVGVPLSTLDGATSCSVIVDPDVVYPDIRDARYPGDSPQPADAFWADEFTAGARVPTSVQDLVIYELFVGGLFNPRDPARPGELEDALRLLDYLKGLGVNAVELLPVSEFGGVGASRSCR
jgi:1,4-alpha-glucan branching enzyme